jgi:hypothetical protein
MGLMRPNLRSCAETPKVSGIGVARLPLKRLMTFLLSQDQRDVNSWSATDTAALSAFATETTAKA